MKRSITYLIIVLTGILLANPCLAQDTTKAKPKVNETSAANANSNQTATNNGNPTIQNQQKAPIVTTSLKNKCTTKNYYLDICYDFTKDTIRPKNIYWVKEDKGGLNFRIKNVNLLNYDVTINNSRLNYEDGTPFSPQNLQVNLSINEINTDFIQQVMELQTSFNTYINDMAFYRNYTSSDSLQASSPAQKNTNAYKNSIKKVTNDSLNNVQNIKDYYNLSISKKSPDQITESVMYLGQTLHLLKDKINNYCSYERLNWLQTSISYYNDLSFLLHKDDSSLLGQRNTLTQIYITYLIDTSAKNDPLYTSYKLLNQLPNDSKIFNYIQYRKNKLFTTMNEVSVFCNDILNEINKIELLIAAKEKTLDSINKDLYDVLKSDLALTETKIRQSLGKTQAVTRLITSSQITDFIKEIQRLYNSFDRFNSEIGIKDYTLNNIDVINLDVDIQPKSNLYGYKARKESFSTKIYTYGGIRLDVSGGLFFNMALNDRKYFYDTIQGKTDTVQIKRIADKNSFIPYVGTQLNIYCNKPFRAPFSPGVSIGVSTNLSDIRYYLGPCMVFGNQDRVVVSGGAVCGKVDMLAGKYNTSDYYNVHSLPQDPTVEKVFRVGWYLSLTYNFTSPKAKAFGEKITNPQ